MSDTWETDVPAAAPRYRTLEPGLIQMLSTPPRMAAATVYSINIQIRSVCFFVVYYI